MLSLLLEGLTSVQRILYSFWKKKNSFGDKGREIPQVVTFLSIETPPHSCQRLA